MNDYHWPYYYNYPVFNPTTQQNWSGYPFEIDHQDLTTYIVNHDQPPFSKDQGRKPSVINISQATKQNKTFRTAIWTGKYLQVTLMSIKVGDEIGLEIHSNHDQFLRIEAGNGLVLMGDNKEQLTFQRRVASGSAIMVPAGTWHNIKNTGNQPLKLYSIYAPPEHAFGTVHQTKAEALAAEHH
ncbi:MAG TPA: cupin domain-containing protein [Bacilli bacterium]|nr:cupin domain-containing protein [Bacilli bacterium]